MQDVLLQFLLCYNQIWHNLLFYYQTFYLPFSDCWGFEFGGEFFHADFYMNGGLGRLKIKTPDEIFGWGVNAGIFAEIPINKKVSLFGSAGYNFTDNWTARAWSDFDGWSGFAGVRINLND